MTAVAVPYAEDGLFPPCPIAGCQGITETEGQPCAGCRELFGDYLTHDPAGRPMTTPEVIAHKAATLDAYRTMTAPLSDLPPELPPETRTALDELHARFDAPRDKTRKANQRCWCCEERHTCTRNARGLWECDTCRTVEQ